MVRRELRKTACRRVFHGRWLCRRGRRRAGATAFIVLAATVLIPAAPALAQTTRAPGAEQMTREEMQAAIHAQFEREMVEELGLDQPTMEAIRGVMTAMVERRRELYQRRRALRALSREFHESDGDEAMARRILSETRAIRSHEALLEADEESQLLQIMSPAEVLRFQALRDDFNDRIRRMHRGRIDGI